MPAHFGAGSSHAFIPLLEALKALGEGKHLKAAAIVAPYAVAWTALPLGMPLLMAIAPVAPLAAVVLAGVVEADTERRNLEAAKRWAAAHPPIPRPEVKHSPIKWVNLNAGKPGMSAHWVGEQIKS